LTSHRIRKNGKKIENKPFHREKSEEQRRIPLQDGLNKRYLPTFLPIYLPSYLPTFRRATDPSPDRTIDVM